MSLSLSHRGSTIDPAQKTERAGWQLTLGGLLLLGVALLVGLSAMFNQANLLFLVSMVSVASVGVCWWSSRPSVDRIVVERQLPSSVIAGQRFTVTYRLRSERERGRSYSIFIRDRLETGRVVSPLEAFVPVILPGQEIEVEVPAVAPQRGVIRFQGITLETRFPFGLTRRYRRLSLPAELPVIPALLDIRTQIFGKAGGLSDIAGTTGRRTSSWGEFYGLRDYRHGDNPHWIHWRRSAKTGKLVVREMIEPNTAKVVLVVDLNAPSPESTESHDPTTETLIRAAATLGCAALDAHASVGWIILGQTTSLVPPAGGLEQRDRLLMTLAQASYQFGRPLHQALAQTHFSLLGQAHAYVFTQADDLALAPSLGFLNDRVRRTEVIRPSDALYDRLFGPEPHSDHAYQGIAI